MTELKMPGATPEYAAARERLRTAEMALCDQRETVAAMRRALPVGPAVPDYSFFEGDKRVRLSELFAAGKNELIVYHLMYWADDDEFCPMCSAWIDALDGVAHHISQRANIVVATRAPYSKLAAWAKKRRWQRIRFLSDDGVAFARDTAADKANGEPTATIIVFVKTAGVVRHVYTAQAENGERVRGIDLLNPLWHALDLLPSGRGDFNASNSYV
jgi:predicted dithiol-disulfide oxidoreductase (DUF899 family)